MAIADTDVFLVANTSGTNYKVTAASLSNFVSTHTQSATTPPVVDNDVLLVSSSSGVNYKIDLASLKTYTTAHGGGGSSGIAATDVFLISNASGVNNKITASKLADYLYSKSDVFEPDFYEAIAEIIGRYQDPAGWPVNADANTAYYLTEASGGTIWGIPSNNDSGDLITSPDGNNWTLTPDVSKLPNGSRPGWLFSVGNNVVFGNNSTGKNAKHTSNDGSTWTEYSTVSDYGFATARHAVHSTGSMIMAIGNTMSSGQDYAHTTSNGLTWTRKGKLPHPGAAGASVIYNTLTEGNGVWIALMELGSTGSWITKSTNGGASWSAETALPGHGAKQILFDPLSGNFMITGTDTYQNKCYYSSNNGASWTWSADQGFSLFVNRSFNYTQTYDPSVGFVEGQSGTATTNGGKTWTKLFIPVKAPGPESYFLKGQHYTVGAAMVQRIPILTNAGRVGSFEKISGKGTFDFGWTEYTATNVSSSGSGLTITTDRQGKNNYLPPGKHGTGYAVGDQVKINGGTNGEQVLEITGVF